MIPSWLRRRWGNFTSEEFTHFVESGVFERKDKSSEEEDHDLMNEKEKKKEAEEATMTEENVKVESV